MFSQIKERANKITTMIDNGRCWINPVSRTDVETLLRFADEANMNVEQLLITLKAVLSSKPVRNCDEVIACADDFLKRWEGK